MNKRVYVNVTKTGFSQKIAAGVSKCKAEATLYAVCASSMGLGIELNRCEKEFKILKKCLGN
jgi:hypothetical protein